MKHALVGKAGSAHRQTDTHKHRYSHRAHKYAHKRNTRSRTRLSISVRGTYTFSLLQQFPIVASNRACKTPPHALDWRPGVPTPEVIFPTNRGNYTPQRSS